ncbi:MAG: hypothetical protein Q8R37_05290 [Nanoarchaeota archaeon]|nr:hypothetical protein [Nanoarchaeota archaeon]
MIKFLKKWYKKSFFLSLLFVVILLSLLFLVSANNNSLTGAIIGLPAEVQDGEQPLIVLPEENFSSDTPISPTPVETPPAEISYPVDIPRIPVETPLQEDLPVVNNISLGDEITIPNNTLIPSVHRLALVFNQANIDYDREYALEYLNLRHNFSDIEYVEVGTSHNFTMRMGNYLDDLKGVNINSSNFAVHLIFCDEFKKFCKFRINGVPTTTLYTPDVLADSNTFDIDGNYILKLNSAEFNKCNNQVFCHLGYEGYHEVDVAVERK